MPTFTKDGILVQRSAPRDMPSKETSCEGKVKYHRLEQAIDAAKELRLVKGLVEPLTVYGCRFCSHFHVGRSTKFILSRLRIVKSA
jgi:hypothetical protein